MKRISGDDVIRMRVFNNIITTVKMTWNSGSDGPGEMIMCHSVRLA